MEGGILKEAKFDSEIIDLSELNKCIFMLMQKTEKGIICKKTIVE